MYIIENLTNKYNIVYHNYENSPSTNRQMSSVRRSSNDFYSYRYAKNSCFTSKNVPVIIQKSKGFHQTFVLK